MDLEQLTYEEGLMKVAECYATHRMIKVAAIDWGKLVESIKQLGQRAGSAIKKDPYIYSPLLGAGLGGSFGLMTAAMQPKERRNYLGRGLTGAVVGGLGGLAVPLLGTAATEVASRPMPEQVEIEDKLKRKEFLQPNPTAPGATAPGVTAPGATAAGPTLEERWKSLINDPEKGRTDKTLEAGRVLGEITHIIPRARENYTEGHLAPNTLAGQFTSPEASLALGGTAGLLKYIQDANAGRVNPTSFWGKRLGVGRNPGALVSRAPGTEGKELLKAFDWLTKGMQPATSTEVSTPVLEAFKKSYKPTKTPPLQIKNPLDALMAALSKPTSSEKLIERAIPKMTRKTIQEFVQRHGLPAPLSGQAALKALTTSGTEEAITSLDAWKKQLRDIVAKAQTSPELAAARDAVSQAKRIARANLHFYPRGTVEHAKMVKDLRDAIHARRVAQNAIAKEVAIAQELEKRLGTRIVPSSVEGATALKTLQQGAKLPWKQRLWRAGGTGTGVALLHAAISELGRIKDRGESFWPSAGLNQNELSKINARLAELGVPQQ